MKTTENMEYGIGNKGGQSIRSFKDLNAWQEGHELVLLIYRLTKKFPKDELFGLVSQIRRAAVSITSNIAEGFARSSFREKAQFYSIAKGSVTELENQLLISKDIGYITDVEFADAEERALKVNRIIHGLIQGSKKFLALAVFLIPYSLFCIPATAQAALTDGLVGHWTFDGKDVNWATNLISDNSGQGNTARITALSTTTTPTLGKFGQGFLFGGGTSDSITVSNASSIDFGANQNFTIAAWVKTTFPAAVNRWPNIVSKDDAVATRQGYNIVLHDSNIDSRWYMEIFVSGTQYPVYGTTDVADGEWHFIVGVRSGSTVYTYEDGVFANQAAASSGSLAKSIPLAIGNISGNGSRYRGVMDDVRVYNRALSATEITQLYKTGAAKLGVTPRSPAASPLAAGLVGHWTFDGKDTVWSSLTAGTVLDKSGQGSTGTLTNMNRTTSPTIGKLGQALRFDGANDYIDLASPTALDDLSAYTVMAWIYPRSLGEGSFGRIIDKEQTASKGWIFYVCNSVSVPTCTSSLRHTHYFTGDDGIWSSANNSIVLNKWQHVAVTYDPSSTSNNPIFYINNAVSAIATEQEPTLDEEVDAANDATIGNRVTGDRTFDGPLDDVRIYNRVLSAAEIGEAFKQGAAKFGVTPASPLRRGLVGHWTFDGKDMNWTANTASDLSGQGNSGRLTDMSTTTSPVLGKLGQALKFDGSNDYVEIGNSLKVSNASSGTITAWMYMDTTGSERAIFGYGGAVESGFGDRLVVETSTIDTLQFSFRDDTNGSNTITATMSAFTPKTWNHIAVVSTDTAYLMYVNGTSVTFSGTNNGMWFADVIVEEPDASLIGAVKDDGIFSEYLDGRVDDVRIYNRALSAGEIRQLYLQGASKSR